MGGRRKKSDAGPKYPNKLLRELKQPLDLNDRRKRRRAKKAEEEEEEPASLADVYEYEDAVPQEESGKNKRFDTVEKLEYESPSDFEDEEIDEDAAFGEDEEEPQIANKMTLAKSKKRGDASEDDEEEDDEDEDEDAEEDDERYRRMMEEVTGKSAERDDEEPEENTGPNAEDNAVTFDDLLAPLQDKPGIKALKKKMHRFEKHSAPTAVPLPKVIQDKLDRQAGYEKTSKDITKWEWLVKRNREAQSLNFAAREKNPLVTTASMAADFVPTSDFEKQIANVLKESGVSNPEEVEAAESLALNKLSVDEVKARQERLAKMRNLLFYHEAKAKRIKKIKSKTFHRLKRKSEKSKADLLFDDPELQKEAALKQDKQRAEERMTLKHKNTSKWAKRILQRGLQHKEDGTREAIAEQLRQHELLTKKVLSATLDSSSEDGSTSESEPELDGQEEEQETGLVLEKKRNSKILAKAKMNTLKALEGNEEAEIPKSGLFSLPFMVRAIEAKRKEAEDEAAAILEEYERAEDEEEEDLAEDAPAGNGKMSFGNISAPRSAKHAVIDEIDQGVFGQTDSEQSGDEGLARESRQRRTEASNTHSFLSVRCDEDEQDVDEMVEAAIKQTTTTSEKAVSVEIDRELFKTKSAANSVISTNPSIFGDGHGSKRSFGSRKSENRQAVTVAGRSKESKQKPDEEDEDGKAESAEDEAAEDEDTIVMASGRSQEELIQQAFAGDDVLAEFQDRKLQTMEDEGIKKNNIEEKDLPGWGQWTDVQKQKGPPKWLLEEREKLKQEQEAAKKRRQDAKLDNVIISEQGDKKAEKLFTTSLPFPYKSKEVFEKTIRMPLGRDFNAVHSVRELTKPAVIKRAGVMIEPIAYEKPVKKRKTALKPSGRSKAA